MTRYIEVIAPRRDRTQVEIVRRDTLPADHVNFTVLEVRWGLEWVC